jgi:hypothetical protein
MNERERTAWVIRRLGNDANRDDLILDLCQLEGWSWPQAQAFIEWVEEAYAARIHLRKSPWLLLLSAGALILGLVQSGSAITMLFQPLLKNLHGPLTLLLLAQSALAVPLFVPQVIAGLGLAVGGLIGLFHTLQTMREL